MNHEPSVQSSPNGFTLVELMVAVVVVGILTVLTHQVFLAVADTSRRLERSLAALERRQNATRWLSSAFLSLEVGDSAGSFEGHRSGVEFTTWVPVPQGWMRRCRVRLTLQDQAFSARACGTRLMLGDSVTEVAFDYLLEPGAESRWVNDWMSPVSAPLAVRIRTGRRADGRAGGRLIADTVLFLIKGRG